MDFEFVQQVCYDTGNALLEYGHNPRPQILIVKKKHGKQPRNKMNIPKIVQQVCFDTGIAVLEYCPNPGPQNVHDRFLPWWFEHEQVKAVSPDPR